MSEGGRPRDREPPQNGDEVRTTLWSRPHLSRSVETAARVLAGTVLVTVLGVSLSGCGRTQPRPPPSEQRAPLGPVEEGIASHYHARFAGRKTASGAPYRPSAMTAAHLRLPFGTVVRVTRIDKQGRRVAGPIEVVINDRGPYAKGRVIDLSEVAARRLGLYNDIARVRLEVVALPNKRP